MDAVTSHMKLAIIPLILKFTGVLNLPIGWVIALTVLFSLPGIPVRTIAFVVFQLAGLFASPVSWWFILLPIAIDVFSLLSFFPEGTFWFSFAASALLFAVLMLCGVITISWWWIIVAILVMAIPGGNTIAFIVFKTCGLFAMPVSWWFIIASLALDINGLHEALLAFQKE